jgi:energy-coupling factor transporter transmembrane protein EcfT
MRAPESFAPGVYGYLILLAGVTAGFMFLSTEVQLGGFAALLIYTAAFHREALSRMARWPMVVFAVTVLAVSSLHLGRDAAGHMVVSPDLSGIIIGLRMLLRASGIFIAAQIFAVRVPVLDLTRLADAAGLQGFGFSLGVAFHMLPEVHAIARVTGDALRLRGTLRTHRVRAARQWVTAILVQVVQRSDEIVSSARTRGFGSGRRYRYLPAWRLGDTLMLVIMTAVFILGS